MLYGSMDGLVSSSSQFSNKWMCKGRPWPYRSPVLSPSQFLQKGGGMKYSPPDSTQRGISSDYLSRRILLHRLNYLNPSRSYSQLKKAS